jgi:hypothetical protein
MAQYTAYMGWVIVYFDRTKYDAAVAAYGQRVAGAPDAVMATLGVAGGPVDIAARRAAGESYAYFVYPFWPGSEFRHPGPSGLFVDSAVASTLVPGQPSAVDPSPPDGLFVWDGVLSFQGGGEAPGVPPTPGPIRPRQFICGWEMPAQGEGGSFSGSGGNGVSRDASRTIDGYGFAMRSTTGNRTQQANEFGASAAQSVWERIYIRLRAAPSTKEQFWAMSGSISGVAMRARILPSGAIEVFDAGTAGVAGTSAALTVGRWYKVDFVWTFSSVNTPSRLGRFQLYLDGVQVFEYTSSTNAGIGAFQTHLSSIAGNSEGTSFGLELDVDDWSSMSLDNGVNPGDIVLPTGIDWLYGTHMQLVGADGFAASHNGAAWTGADWRSTLQNPISAAATTAQLTSTTSGPTLAVTVSEGLALQQVQLGAAAMVVGIHLQRFGSNGQLGYSIAGGAPVLVADTTNVASFEWDSMMYRPSGMITPAVIAPVELVHVKASDTSQEKVDALMAVVEYIGTWEVEDAPSGTSTVGPTGLHNAPYPFSAWALDQPPPSSPVYVGGGTYTGNGAGQDVTLPWPGHWWHLHRVPASSNDLYWWPSLLGTHEGLATGHEPAGMVQALYDGVNANLRVTGIGPQINENAASLQWISFMDPGGRFNLTGALAHANSVSVADTALVDTGFTPEAGFFFIDEINGSTNRLWYKGLGHAADAASPLDGAENTSAITFSTGSIRTRTVIHAVNNAQIGYSLWRRNDGSGGNAVHIGFYTGDGTASRVIACVLGGRYPMYALVVPHNATSIYRDPSHTSNNSTTATGSTTTTGITAGGVDSITVGITLNANAIVYDVFVIPGCSSSSWSNGICSLTAPVAAPGSQYTSTTPGGPVGPALPSSGGGCPTSGFPLPGASSAASGCSPPLFY